ncbi:MAG TPA: pyrroline-5-carboxylate reductase [Beijerinckiaceae bacterium]|nr:pyrroline-5-carboxylate reductase [Beijerinckiaceae bacterium]
MTAPSQAYAVPLVLFGAGKMGGAMLEGWLADGLSLSSATILDPQPSLEVQTLCAEKRIALNPPLREIPPPKVVVLAIKPQTLDAAGQLIGRLVGEGTLVVSILAGKTIADLKRHAPRARAIVRAMPNLAASVRRSATAAVATPETSEEQRALAQKLLASIGTVEWLPGEELINAVTAVSGSGPAYFFYLAECLAQAGMGVGLSRDLADHLARATLVGAGELLAQSELPPAKLRHDVTSPGGTTAAALQVLMGEEGLLGVMQTAVAAAKRRADELSG